MTDKNTWMVTEIQYFITILKKMKSLLSDLIILLAKNNYLHVKRDEVYKEIFE